MKIYLDLVLFINFFLDYLLLLSISILLKRKAKMFRVIFGAFLGSLSIILLFIRLNNIQLFFIKFIISVIMVLISFGFHSFKYTVMNLFYLYIVSIFLGGSLYFINNMFAYDRKGIIFINNGYSINLIILLILGPIIIYIYNKQASKLKTKYNHYYDVKITYQDQTINLVGYLDTGNTLLFNNKSVLLLDKRKNIFKIKKYLIIPYNTIDNTSLMQAFKADQVLVNNKEIKNCLIGLIDPINIDGVGMILNNKIGEMI